MRHYKAVFRFTFLSICLAMSMNSDLVAQRQIATDPEVPFGGTYFDRARGGGADLITQSILIDQLRRQSPEAGRTRSAEEINNLAELIRAGEGGAPVGWLAARSLVGTTGLLLEQREHRPLIQVKVRVIEVERSDGMSVSSVLELVNGSGVDPTKTSGRSLNTTTVGSSPVGRQNERGATNFSIPGLISNLTTGSGGILNLTTDHINWLASFLATEFHGDILTAPQVTTIHGETVVFQSGQKVPFQIGANIISQNANAIQQFFYKHVGTYIAVTPQIVNWEKYKGGTTPPNPDLRRLLTIQPQDILNLESIAQFLVDGRSLVTDESLGFPKLERAALETEKQLDAVKVLNKLDGLMARYVNVIRNNSPVPQREQVDRDFLTHHTGGLIQPAVLLETGPCNFEPTDCTIDLEIVVRLSDLGSTATPDAEGGSAEVTSENNVRSIANIVQVQSGNGVVMGGLISMRDDEAIEKIPVLGDLPVVGTLFRSKQNQRRKVETLIFVEATVLPSLNQQNEHGENSVESITSEDFCNARQHLQCDICNTDLYKGICAAGLANGYLPNPTSHEQKYWKQYQRSIRDARHKKVKTQILDIIK